MVAVEILESCMVAPGEATPKHRLWLSVFDLVQPRTHTPLLYLYRPSPRRSAFFSPDILKAALSKALVPFYPIAGRLGSESDGAGRPEILCTGDGVLFVTARADATLDQLENLAPSDQHGLLMRRRALVPLPLAGDGGGAGVLAMFQLTFLKCGGVCLGTAIHHTVSDGHAFGGFLKTWAAVARAEAAGSEAATLLLLHPRLDRTLLRSRSPPAPAPAVRFQFQFQHAVEYPPRGSVPSEPKVPFHVAILPISKDQVDALKGAAGPGPGPGKVQAASTSTSTFSAVVAHVWRCMCKAKGLRGTEGTRVYAWANARPRIHPPLPAEGYLGNAVVRTSTAVATVDDVVSSSLSSVAGKVSAATARVSDEYVRSLADYLELAMSAEPGLHLGRWAIPDSDLFVISWIGLPIYDVDFGWGGPSFVGRATYDHRNVLYLVSSPDGDGPLNVTITMEPEALSKFKLLFLEGLKQYSRVPEIDAALDARGIKHSKL